MRRRLLVVLVLLFAGPARAAFIDFNGLGVSGDPAPAISADGVTVTFGGLEIAQVTIGGNGFVGPAGTNQVVAADQGDFDGEFLTAAGFGTGEVRPFGFVRTIFFDGAVSALSVIVADIDFQQGVTAEIFDAGGASLGQQIHPGSLALDARTRRVGFGATGGIRRLTLAGNDPVGIDNLRFTAAAGLPEPGVLGLAGLALLALSRRRLRPGGRSS